MAYLRNRFLSSMVAPALLALIALPASALQSPSPIQTSANDEEISLNAEKSYDKFLGMSNQDWGVDLHNQLKVYFEHRYGTSKGGVYAESRTQAVAMGKKFDVVEGIFDAGYKAWGEPVELKAWAKASIEIADKYTYTPFNEKFETTLGVSKTFEKRLVKFSVSLASIPVVLSLEVDGSLLLYAKLSLYTLSGTPGLYGDTGVKATLTAEASASLGIDLNFYVGEITVKAGAYGAVEISAESKVYAEVSMSGAEAGVKVTFSEDLLLGIKASLVVKVLGAKIVDDEWKKELVHHYLGTQTLNLFKVSF